MILCDTFQVFCTNWSVGAWSFYTEIVRVSLALNKSYTEFRVLSVR